MADDANSAYLARWAAPGWNMATETAQSNPKPSEGLRAGRAAILAAARRVLARDGAAALSFENVASEAGVTPESLPQHFQNPQEMVFAVASDPIASLSRSMQGEESKAKASKSESQVQSQPQTPSRDGVRKKAVLPAPLEQVMKEVAPDPEKDQVITGAMARLERRVQVMEKAFADIVDRHEKSLRERSGSMTSIEESISGVLSRMDATDKHHTDMFGELRLAVANASTRLSALEEVKHSSMAAAPISMEPLSVPELPAMEQPQKAFDLSDVLGARTPETKPSGEPAMTSKAGEGPKPAENETYLSAARRAANAAAVTAAEDGMRATIDTKRSRKGNRAKFLLFACLAPVAILGVAFGVLNQHGVTAEPFQISERVAPPAPTAAPAQPTAAEQPFSPQLAVAGSDPRPANAASAMPLDSLTQRAEAGDVTAARDVGLKYLAGDGIGIDESEAARWLMRAAYKGEPTSEYWLATLYARGRGVPADAFQANHWYEAAAKKGNRRAMHSLAVAYFQGWGMEKNFVEAARWFEKASELGLVDSQFNLGVLYERGAGVPQSLTDAYKWYAIAAAHGDKEADARIAFLATQLRPADLALAQSAAAGFKPMPMDEAANVTTETAQRSGG